MNLLENFHDKIDSDARISEQTNGICQSCIQSISYILQPLPHRKLSADFTPNDNYCAYIKHLSASIRRNRSLSDANYQNLILLVQTLQSQLWVYNN